MIDDERKFIFVENSKTGTYSIKKALMQEHLHDPMDPRTPTINHKTPAKIKAEYPIKWASYTSFVVVRNTWDRAHSFFEFYRDANGATSYESLSFDEWVAQSCPAPEEDHLRAVLWGEGRRDDVLDQLRYVEGVDEIIVVHSFDGQERSRELQNGFDRVCSILKMNCITLPHVNDIGRSKKSIAWRRETVDRLRALYGEEIERFGFEEPEIVDE